MNIFVVDDHVHFRAGVAFALRGFDPGITVQECASVENAVTMLENGSTAELVVLDLQMPGHEGTSALCYLRKCKPEVPVLVLSGSDDPEIVRRAIDTGACGFIHKSAPPESLQAALRLILSGGAFLPASSLSLAIPDASHGVAENVWRKLGARLTPRQCDVLRGLVQGKPNKTLARDLNISDATIKTHIGHIFDVLDVRNRTQVVYALARAGVSLNELVAIQ